MSDQGLSAPGTSVYSSDSMYVGDGTWDSQRNTFLLPNLQGLNFETMRYNGMGNRFRNMIGYKAIVTAHAILAAIAFLLVVPAAIFMARFYHRNPRTALRFHIWLQILTVLLSTAAFILGFQAVGRERSLSNPHHGIGVALYTLVMVQALGGSVIHKLEKGKERFKIPLKLMIHQWLGRLIALLGIVQVPLGLTLYGSPKVLFILFSLWTFILLILYFVLSYRTQPEMGFDDRTTYITERTGSTRSKRSRGHGLGALATAGAAGAGLAALRRRSRSRSRSRRSGSRQEVLSSRRDSRSRINESRFTDSYLSDEKYASHPKKGGTWKNRLLGAGAAAGGIYAIKSLFSRNKKHAPTETGSDVSYSRPLGPSEVTQTDLTRLEEGRAPASPANNRDDWRRVEEREAAQAAAMAGSPLRKGHRPARSGGSIDSFDSRTSISDERDTRPRQHSYGLKEGIVTLGVLGFLKHSWSKRRNKKEDAHVEELRQQDLEEERVARMNSQRRKYTGDGAPPRRSNRPPSTILSESDLTDVTPSVARPNLPPPPMNPGVGPSAAHIRPPPTDSYGVLSESGSEAYTSPGGRQHRRHQNAGNAALAAGAGAAAASTGSPSRRDHSQRRSSREGSVASPPVSVKVKMHNDGRHVTLRRLNEEEAAAEREARRKERQRRNRTGSESSLGNLDGDRWRRTEALEAAQAQEMAQSAAPPPPPGSQAGPLRMPEPVIPPPPPGPPPGTMSSTPGHIPLPPPPPIPAAAGSVLSSPHRTQVYGTETDVSNYDSNRRRRRAERAQAKQARMGGSRVEFS
ncbi:Nn.00g037650.m01.CDS01 [Neocucurbitaria sp. VM-36]